MTDRIGSNELVVEYFPTGEILGNIFTKSVQGKFFIKFRKHILNFEHDDLLAYSPERSQKYVGMNKAVPKDRRTNELKDPSEDNSTHNNVARHCVNMTYADVLRSNK